MKPNVFIDTNVMIDLLGERDPFYENAAKIASLADKSKITLFVSALSFSTTGYILSKYYSPENVKDKLRKFKIISKVCDLTESIIEKGLNSKFNDFEDSLQYFSALENECNILITRNTKDFAESHISILTPDDFLKTL